MSQIEKLREKIIDAENQLRLKKRDYIYFREKLHLQESVLTTIKKEFNLSHREWKKEEKRLRIAKGRLSRFPYSLRKYGKEHAGQIIAKMQD